jgi:hypothetical protein
LNVLQSIVDVTERVNAAVTAGLAPDEAMKARRRVMAAIEKESLDATGFRSDVVTLYQGGAYHLYRFKKYTDVRLVFAPEQQVAFFGGDPDNFEYPRFDLDICLFRAYENGKAVKAPHYLKWSKQGAAEGELTFVSGHPGRTERLLTVAELEYLRDRQYPISLAYLKRREVLMRSWSERSGENARRAKDDLFGIQNSRKARDGGHAGLYDPSLMESKRQQEKALRTVTVLVLVMVSPGSVGGFGAAPFRLPSSANTAASTLATTAATAFVTASASTTTANKYTTIPFVYSK